jgi:hypothetical protein
MVLIAELKTLPINLSVQGIRYTEGPNHFDEWYTLARLKFPNALNLWCDNNGLRSLHCPEMLYVSCNNNKIVDLDLPNAIHVYCTNNYLETLKCPKAVYVFCYNNYLTFLNVHDALYVYCWENDLYSLICTNAVEILCHNNKLNSIFCPVAQVLQYDTHCEGRLVKVFLPSKEILLLDNQNRVLNYNIMKDLLTRRSF